MDVVREGEQRLQVLVWRPSLFLHHHDQPRSFHVPLWLLFVSPCRSLLLLSCRVIGAALCCAVLWPCVCVCVVCGVPFLPHLPRFVPSCPNSEAVAVCGNGQNGQISAAATTSFTPCAAGTLDAVELMGIAQVGLTINAPPKESCLLYGCSRTQCLRTDRACPDASGPASYSCVDGEYIVDIQPFPMAVCISLVVLAVVLFVTRRPYDLSNARLAGVLIVSFGLYHLAGTVGVYRSCPWDSMTASSCESIPDGVSPPHQVRAGDVARVVVCMLSVTQRGWCRLFP